MIRHIDLWTIARVSLLFNIVVGIMFLIAGVVLWKVVIGLAFVGKLETLAGKLAGGTFRIKGDTVFWIWFVVVMASVAFFTAMSMILAMLYNLIADTVGGVSFEIEDRVVKRDRLMQRAFASVRGTSDGDKPKRARPDSGTPNRKPVSAGQKRPAPSGGAKPKPATTGATTAATTGAKPDAKGSPASKSSTTTAKTPAPVRVSSDDVIPNGRQTSDANSVAPVPKPKK